MRRLSLASAAVAATVAALAVPLTLSATAAGPSHAVCRRAGTGALHDLWLTPAGACPAGWSAYALSGSAGAPGPAGPKGDPGDSRLTLAAGSRTLPAGVAANETWAVTVSGMPPYSATQARRIFRDLNGEAIPAPMLASVGTPSAVAGATTWTFPVTVTGATVATPAVTLRLDVLALPVA